ncbi:MAG: hypothetical protein P0Y65_05215 [Candidatus Devosia phytovorans]|uniref:Uncharacterized protein n=1 Tax=Candidatus Devosia phytovorans TaxID=3121372 RepID=A0AAJ5VX24_9HYPH|nr:hypothetical protein [Devosia sp.]WEK05656.1 MAG: hypothetical protein P0Y65_05215 [Devosia sp.]
MLRLFALAVLLLATPAYADGRADWTDYAWKQIVSDNCDSDGTTTVCPLYHQKWDWKRDQWVDIAISMDLGTGHLTLTQRLTNRSPTDDDHVCVTVIAVDSNGRNIIAHHQNWHSDPGQVSEKTFSYSSPALARIAAFHIGSKQCRKGAGQDDALYESVLAGIQR